MRCLERLFRRAGLPLGMSQGFHPKPRMTFPSALAVGIAGTDEIMELELAESCTADKVLDKLTRHAPPGLTINSVDVLPPGCKKAQVRSVSYQMPVPPQYHEGLSRGIDKLIAGSSCPIHRPNRRTPIDLRPLLEELTLRDGVLSMRLLPGSQGSPRPREVLGILGLDEVETMGVHLTRTTVEIQPDPAPNPDRMRACLSCPTRKQQHETRNADQRFTAGRMPDCNR